MRRESVHDERIMADGRPAFAWWNEIQMLRADKARIDNLTNEMLDMNALLRIVKVVLDHEPSTGDIVIRLDRLERIKARSFTLRGLIAEMMAAERTPSEGGAMETYFTDQAIAAVRAWRALQAAKRGE